MFENLTEKLNGVFRSLTGRGRLTESNIQEALGEVRNALLEADVNLQVAKDFIEQVREKAIGQEVLKTLRPDQVFVKVIYDEMVRLMGPVDAKIPFKQPGPLVIMMAGLQGSGKTTTCGKLAKLILEKGHKPQLVACDCQRPAAIEQLMVVGGSVGVPVYSEGIGDPVRIARMGVKAAAAQGCDVVIVDTAGRLHIDQAMMQEAKDIARAVQPDQIYLVCDAMTGQDAVTSAKEFNAALELTGVILTKLDGDARGGAALSIRHVTGQPIKFIGTGEKADAFEPFHPDRIVGRILGMGDMMSLIEKAESTLDRKKSEEFAKKALLGDGFTLEDFRDQLRQIKKMGSMESILKMLPSVGPFAGLQQASQNIDEKQFVRLEAIINSMTPIERRNHEIISGSRRKRIASGSGTTVQDVNQLLRQYAQMSKMFKQMGKGGLARNMMRGGLGAMGMGGKQRFGR